MTSRSKAEIVIVGYSRTPIGRFKGTLSQVSAPTLGAYAIRAAISDLFPTDKTIDAVIMGCVLSAGIGQAPARQAAISAGLPDSVECTTINKMCGSGLQAVMMAYDAIKAGSAEVVIAGGMESMSNAPYIVPDLRKNSSFGHSQLLDHMIIDGLEDPWQHRAMGSYAEDCAKGYRLTRSIQDEYAIRSLSLAIKARRQGYFKQEITGVNIESNALGKKIVEDDIPNFANLDKVLQLKPVFKNNGTVTAASSSSISDGAAAVVLMTESTAIRFNLKPVARIIGKASHAQAPERFPTAPIEAIRSLLKRLTLTVDDIDLFEINEAFAVVPLVAMAEFGIPQRKVNIHGGACALGHPIGASGARILVTLISALERYNLDKGLATLCIGGGEANAVAIERWQS